MTKGEFESLLFINRIRLDGVKRRDLPKQVIAILEMQKSAILTYYYEGKYET